MKSFVICPWFNKNNLPWKDLASGDNMSIAGISLCHIQKVQLPNHHIVNKHTLNIYFQSSSTAGASTNIIKNIVRAKPS